MRNRINKLMIGTLSLTVVITSFLNNSILADAKYSDMIKYSETPKITINKETVIGDKSTEIDQSETIFDLYSKEERFILYRIVEAECTGLSKECKKNVANVIINRVNNDEFPDTIEEVVLQKVCGIWQFSPLKDKRYYSVEITDETKEACAEIFQEEDTTDGCLYFDSCDSSWASRNMKFVFSDDYHNFYK